MASKTIWPRRASRSGAPIFWPTTGGIFRPRACYDLAIKRLEDKGRGILLLHDIQARTVAALPKILHELKARGYRIVHVVPATPERPATPTEPMQWQLHPPSENVAISHWPKIPNFVFSGADTLPARALPDLDWREAQSMTLAEALDHGRGIARGVPLPREAPWPRQIALPPDRAAPSYRCRHRVSSRSRKGCASPCGPPRRRASGGTDRRGSRTSSIGAANSRRASRARSHTGDVFASCRVAEPRDHAAHARRGKLKHLVQVKKRSV